MGSATIFSAAERQMHWLTTRQRVGSQNLSNVDTPGYRARDIMPLRFQDTLKGNIYAGAASLSRTHPQHFESGRFFQPGRVSRSRDYYEATLSDNSVNLEETLLRLNQNAADYGLVTNLYRKYHSFLSTAAGRRR